jgi:hypothetical protein
MADEKKTSSKKAPETSGEPVAVEDAYDVGWFGTRNTTHPDEAYALTSGPDSPVGEKGPE